MFHDAPVSRIEQIDNALFIETEAFSFGPGERMLAARIAIESHDAEIYGLDTFPDRVELELIWHWYGPDSRETFATYRFTGATVLVQDLAGGPPVIMPEADGV